MCVLEKGDIESVELGVGGGGQPLVRMKSAGVCRVPRELQDLQLALVSKTMNALMWVLTYLDPL
jgi:hypothetical protein